MQKMMIWVLGNLRNEKAELSKLTINDSYCFLSDGCHFSNATNVMEDTDFFSERLGSRLQGLQAPTPFTKLEKILSGILISY